jgi:Aminoglycoside 3-N-acetyltransferase
VIHAHENSFSPLPREAVGNFDARMIGLGAGFNFMTPLHAVECLPTRFRSFERCSMAPSDIAGSAPTANRRARIHETDQRYPAGPVAPSFRVRYLRRSKVSNLRILAADAKPLVEHAVALSRRGITMYIEPVPERRLFVAAKT